MNKKIIGIISTAGFLLSALSGCNQTDIAENKGLSIVTTIFPPYDFARQIGGDKADIKMLTTPGGESHSYEPTPQDIKAVQSCDIFICSGGESDVWANVIIDSINTENITVIKMTECVETVEEEITEGMEEKKELFEHDNDIENDEHVWTSLRNAAKISEAVSEAMILADPENKDFYQKNLDDYTNALSELDKKYLEAVNKAKNTTLIFGDRFPFRYLFIDYGLDYYAAFPGCSTDSDVSAKTMIFLINKAREEKLSTVYYIEFSARKIADTIAKETGAEPLLFHSCHTVSKDDFNNGVTYLFLMEQNLENLKRGLGIETD